MWPDDSLKFPSGEEYRLCGIGHHLGEYFSSGHYVASIKSDTEWIMCNDTQISKSNESDSKSIEINICIYSKVINCTTPLIPTNEWQHEGKDSTWWPTLQLWIERQLCKKYESWGRTNSEKSFYKFSW